MAFAPSKYQQDIFAWVKNGSGNGIVSAVPGSGKSTTIRWIMQSGEAGKCLYLAFNRSIVDAFAPAIGGVKENERWVFKGQASASTFHAFGNKLLNSAVKSGRIQDTKSAWIVKDYLRGENGLELPDALSGLRKHEKTYTLERIMVTLVEKCRLLLVDPREQAQLIKVAEQFDAIIPEVFDPQNPVGEFAALIIEEGTRRFKERGIRDFTDMIYLPIRLNLKSEPFDWVFIDECQDLEEAKRVFATDVIVANRTLAVGDPRQAIMGFTGAAFDSFAQVKRALCAEEMPLSVCYRCPTSAIEIANRIYPGIEARQDAPEGVVRVGVSEDEIMTGARAGDLIICRLNAPLVKHCISLILSGKQANIRGADIGAALCEKLDRVAAKSDFFFSDLVSHLIQARDEQIELMMRKNVRVDSIDALNDQYEALIACVKLFNAPDLKTLKTRISAMFADEGAQIWFSSVHRAKGLEAERVMILRPELLPMLRFDQDGHPTQTYDDLVQEMNLYYVAVTRPTKELWFFGMPQPTDFPTHALAGAPPSPETTDETPTQNAKDEPQVADEAPTETENDAQPQETQPQETERKTEPEQPLSAFNALIERPAARELIALLQDASDGALLQLASILRMMMNK